MTHQSRKIIFEEKPNGKRILINGILNLKYEPPISLFFLFRFQILNRCTGSNFPKGRKNNFLSKRLEPKI